MATNRFKERVRYRRKVITALSIAGFLVVMGMGIAYSILLITRLTGGNQDTALIIGDVIKIIFAFCLAWIMRGVYLNNIDVMVSKMELYEMKILNSILNHEIGRMEKNREDEERNEEEIKQFQRNVRK